MPLFGSRRKNTYYSITLMPTKLNIEGISSLLSDAIRTSGLSLTDNFMFASRGGSDVAVAKVNGDVDVQIAMFFVDDYECHIKFIKPEMSSTDEKLIANAFISFFANYIRNVDVINTYNYWACKGEKDNDRKMFTWTEVMNVVGNDEFIMKNR